MHILNILLIISFCCTTLADNSCIFQHPTKGVIDLTSIGLRNGQPRFLDVSSSLSSYYTYSFNPCYSFTETGCQNAAVCQISSDRLYSFTLATQGISKWTIESDSTPVLTYTYGSKTVSISMICSPYLYDEFEILSENPANHYSMRLQSHCACWNGCKTTIPTTPTTTTTQSPPVTTHVISYNSCMYQDSRYGTIDLSSIGSMKGTPTFKDVSSSYPNNFVWSYNPCYTFSEMNCQNVAGCQIDKTRSISYTIGVQDFAYWINMNTTNSRSIVYPSTSINRRLTVQLICDQTVSSHRLQVIGETSVGEYTMQLTSPCACWNGCVKPAPDPINRTFWTILSSVSVGVFLLFCMLVTCLFCSKPKRRHRVILVDEKTPFIKEPYNFCAEK